jgi:glucosamine-6-phosphate deaminase
LADTILSQSGMSNTPTQSFQAEALSVRVFPTQAELARAVAAEAQATLQKGIEQNGGAAMIFAAANSQIQSLDVLVALGGVDWSRVTMFHMDEYLGLDAQHPASFRRFLRERVEQRVHPKAFQYIEGEALQPLAECERYAELLAAQPIDLCLLGIGENGHLAFNDPPVADFADHHIVKLVKLDEACRQQQVGEGHFPNLAAVPQYAFTLTIPALCAARRMLCIVPERRKAQAVRDALRGPISTACPASFLRQQAHCTLFLDAESASLL